MADYSGKNVFALFGVESAFGTAVTTNKDIGVTNSLTMSDTNNIQEVREIGDRETTDLVVGNFETSTSVEGVLNSGAILELFFGQSTDTQTTGDYTHTFIDASGSETLPNTGSSFTLSSNFDSSSDIVHTYAGCKFNTIDITLEQSGLLSFSGEILGSTVESTTTAGTKVSTTTNKLSGFSATLSTGDDASESSVGRTQTVEISLNNNLERVYELGSRVTQELVEKNFDVEVSFTKTFNNDTEYQRFLGGTSQSSSTPTATSLILDVNNGVTLGSGRVQFYFKMSGGQYSEVEKNVSQDGLVEASFTYIGGNIEDCYFVDAVSSYF